MEEKEVILTQEGYDNLDKELNYLKTEIKNRAKQQIKTIILPEATDIRILKAAQIVNKEKYAKVALIGNKEEIERLIKENNLELGDTQIIDPAKSDKTSEYAKELYELRKAKGMTEEQAQKLILEPIYYGMMMVKLNHADGLVSGAAHSTADTLRPALQILKTAPGTKLVSAFLTALLSLSLRPLPANMLSPRTIATVSSPMNSSPIINACASPSGDGCTA